MAVPRKPAFAVGAETAADVERQHDLVALLHGIDGFADLHHLSQVLVPQDFALFHVRAPLIHMEVGATNVRGAELDDDVCPLLDLRVRNFVDGHLFRAVVHKCFHRFAFRCCNVGESCTADPGTRAYRGAVVYRENKPHTRCV